MWNSSICKLRDRIEITESRQKNEGSMSKDLGEPLLVRIRMTFDLVGRGSSDVDPRSLSAEKHQLVQRQHRLGCLIIGQALCVRACIQAEIEKIRLIGIRRHRNCVQL